MEQVVQKLIEQAPGVAALIVLVMLFLRHIRSEREQQNKFFEQIHADNTEARKDMKTAIERNTVTITDNVRVTSKNTDTIDRLARAIERCEIRGVSS